MDKCFICQDFKINVGHDTKSCPENTCKKCGQRGHIKLECMLGFENFPLPNEIIFKIFNYLDTQTLYYCCQVSKRIRSICLSDQLKSNSMLLKVVDLMNKDPNMYITNESAKAQAMLHSKEWHISINSDFRNHLVYRL